MGFNVQLKIFTGSVVLFFTFGLVLGFAVQKDTEEATTLFDQNEFKLLPEEVNTEGTFSVTENRFVADSPSTSEPELYYDERNEEATSISPVERKEMLLPEEAFADVNDEENELFRDKRDVDAATTTNSSGFSNDEQSEVVTDSASDDALASPTTAPTNGDDFPEFVRPTTPDPNAVYEEAPPNSGIDMDELRQELAKEGVNISGPYVRGRYSCKCGTTVRKIVGGTVASIKDYPWTVGLTRGGRPYCGGSLINSGYVVTASHCVDGQSANRISVVIGEQDYASSFDGANPKRIGVSQIIMHERYNSKTIDNDIALLKLAQPVQLGGQNIPVCLPASNSNDFTGETATVAGWGATSQGGSTSSTLRKVDVPVLSHSECNGGKSRYQGKITQNMLCAGYFQSGGKDSCQGDSGGPLVIHNGGRRTLIGIVSWGYGCAQAYAPGVYTRVGRYPEWILSKTRGAQWCQG